MMLKATMPLNFLKCFESSFPGFTETPEATKKVRTAGENGRDWSGSQGRESMNINGK